MNNHILIVSQYFYPESFRINDIAIELYKRGFKVTVVTGIPNYPQGKFYKGYNWFKKRKESWNGINIIRLPIFSRGKSKLKLAINYYSFPFFGKFWSVFTKLKPNLVLSFGLSPIMQASVGIKISKRLKIPHYLYIQDLWPESLIEMTGIHNKLIVNHYDKLCKKLYNFSTKIFVTSNSFAKVLEERVKDKNKIIYLPQYAESCYKMVNPIRNNNIFKIIYTGNIGEAQGLDILIEVAKRVDNIIFTIVGDGRYKSKFIENSRFIKEKFIFKDRIKKEKIVEELSKNDVAFISLKKNKLFDMTIPAKLQSYLACGMPILGAISGETKRIIEQSNCGLCSEPDDLEGLINNIKILKESDLNQYRVNSINYYKENFDKDVIIEKLIKEITS